jgi:DnaD/phage-associated family protein
MRFFGMNYITISTDDKETFSSISNHFIDYYMTDANGEFVKVYLYLVRLLTSKSPVSVADIADHFNLTEKDICRAIRYWISQDVLKLNYNSQGTVTGITLLSLHAKESKPEDMLSMENIAFFKVADKSKTVSLPAPVAVPKRNTYTPEMAAKAEEDSEFSDVIFEAETYFEKMLSANDMEILIYIHDQLGFSVDLMEYLIEYCVDMKKLSMNYAEKVAIEWYKSGIHTREEAKKATAKYSPLYRSVFKQMGITRTKPTTAETAYMDSWSKELGFNEEIILEACKRAIINRPNSANFAYVNGILENWRKAGVTNVKDIEKLDKEHMEAKSKQTTRYTPKANSFSTFSQKDMSDELAQMEQLFLDEINTPVEG